MKIIDRFSLYSQTSTNLCRVTKKRENENFSIAGLREHRVRVDRRFFSFSVFSTSRGIAFGLRRVCLVIRRAIRCPSVRPSFVVAAVVLAVFRALGAAANARSTPSMRRVGRGPRPSSRFRRPDDTY